MVSWSILFVLSLATFLTDAGVSVHNPFYCYSQDPIQPQNAWFGIHTAYETIRGRNINANVSTCNPSKFWMISRHGTRWPNPTELNNIWASARIHDDILSNYDQGRTSLCASDMELLRNWRFNPDITLEYAQYLIAAGWDELEELGRRYQAAFPTILSSTYSPNDFLFRGSDYQRTQVSLHAFADGLFGENGHEDVNFEELVGNDYLLRAYTLCPLFDQVIANLPERDAFREGPEYQQMTLEVSRKLGFHGSHTLRNNEINTLSLICKYEQIWNLNETSPYCAAFSVANRQVIEYREDLEFYYRLGPGRTEYRRLFENLVCFNMQELLQFMVSNDPNDHKARVYSGHVTILPMLLNNLGALGNDEPLTQHNFAQQSERAWRTGRLIAMAANLAVIRYDCADGDNDLLFLYNEIPLQIPGCDANGVCKQSLIIERLGHWLDADCMEIFCRNS
ncbi:multiple inositol polyphosphate phosphatase 1-like [Bradysia coprophila]|uniref:multiple inositol polyphosphate phosphatase 1-like n=1 Tax=Bradysia coprophila TaxID=38358 RepID=UPI00187D6E97|nr:multiple inositol polyphosphate phosphatase 1-like [Bradysia coprophila]